jgi:hypothetical protein
MMRKVTLNQLESLIKKNGVKANYATLRYRQQNTEQMIKRRPRSNDEIKILDRLVRNSIRGAMAQGKVVYDKEKRVLIVDEFKS